MSSSVEKPRLTSLLCSWPELTSFACFRTGPNADDQKRKETRGRVHCVNHLTRNCKLASALLLSRKIQYLKVSYNMQYKFSCWCTVVIIMPLFLLCHSLVIALIRYVTPPLCHTLVTSHICYGTPFFCHLHILVSFINVIVLRDMTSPNNISFTGIAKGQIRFRDSPLASSVIGCVQLLFLVHYKG